jgi:hypothetical protein
MPSGALLTRPCHLTFGQSFKIKNIIFHTFIQYVVLDEEIEIPCQQTTQHWCALFLKRFQIGFIFLPSHCDIYERALIEFVMLSC